MDEPALRVCLLRDGATAPHHASNLAAGLDLTACLDAPLLLSPGDRARVATGLAIALPSGHEGQVRPRSGLCAMHGVTVLNAPGTIDEDYRGEVEVIVINLGSDPFTIHHGDRIAQLVVAPVTRVRVETVSGADALGSTERARGGFGSTGR